MYAAGAPPDKFADYFGVLRDAQDAACEAVRPGIAAQEVDARAEDDLTGIRADAQIERAELARTRIQHGVRARLQVGVNNLPIARQADGGGVLG